MKPKYRSRRGVTLLELCIVMALVAILSSMVATFTVMTNRRSRAAEERLSAMQEIAMVEAAVDAWFDRHGTASCQITASGNALACDCDGEAAFTLTSVAFHPEHVTGVEFSQSDEVYFCRVTYAVTSTEETITFCVNPRVGETVGATGASS